MLCWNNPAGQNGAVLEQSSRSERGCAGTIQQVKAVLCWNNPVGQNGAVLEQSSRSKLGMIEVIAVGQSGTC